MVHVCVDMCIVYVHAHSEYVLPLLSNKRMGSSKCIQLIVSFPTVLKLRHRLPNRFASHAQLPHKNLWSALCKKGIVVGIIENIQYAGDFTHM